MENLLVTQLKSTFSNQDLKKPDEIRFVVDNDTPTDVLRISSLSPSKEIAVRCTGDLHFTDSTGAEDYGTSMNLAASENILYFKGTKGNVFVGSKGYLQGVSTIDSRVRVNIEDLDYLSWVPYASGGTFSLYAISLGNNKAFGDISEVGCKKTIGSLITFDGNTLVTGSIDKMITDGKTIPTLNINNSKIKLNLKSLASQSNMSADFYCGGVSGDIKYAVYNKRKASGTTISFNVSSGSYPNIYGSIEELVTLGLTVLSGAGSIKLYNLKRMLNVTYQGVSVAENTNIPSSSPTLSWDAQGNISWS